MVKRWTVKNVLDINTTTPIKVLKMRNCCQIVFLLSIMLVTALAVKGSPSGILEDSPLVEVVAAVGKSVVLPCKVAPPGVEPGDRPIMVLIYQGDNRTPAYSLDARGGPLANGEPWSDKAVLGTRAQFQISLNSPSGLVIHSVKGRDHGIYRCRVDFQASPTRNSRIKLQVIVPPQDIVIETEDEAKTKPVIGPYVEGRPLTLRCKVIGGRPRPLISWWRGNMILDNESELNENDATINTLFLPSLKREDLYQNFTCRARNSNITAVISKTVTLDMIFPIQRVEIFGSKEPIREGTARKLICKAFGSRPKAKITWFESGKEIPSAFEKEMESGKVFKSSVIIVPKMKDDGAHIICRASNPDLDTSVMEDTKRIFVYYTPRLNLVPGKGVLLENVKEGDDVYFECEILANPRAHVTRWFYEGSPLLHNISKGVIHSNQSLVLQKISKEKTGTYSCSASNKLGNGSSNDLYLRVKYAPTCPHSDPNIYGAEKYEQISIPCLADAYPKPYDFKWAFNSSSELVDVSEIKDQHKRIITYMPKEDTNFGTLLCWAKNEVDQQKIPCLYHVIHSSLPDPVSNCIFNLSSISATIDCDEGWNGGIDQTFTLQLITNNKKFSKTTEFDYSHRGKGDPRALANTSVAPKPSFVLNGLKPGVKYLVRIAAVNKKGKSSPRNFSFTTPNDMPERQVSSQDVVSFGLNWTFIACLLVGIIFTSFAALGSVFYVRNKFVSRRNRSITTEVALERTGDTDYRDKEELMGCLTTSTSDGVEGIHVRDQSL